MNNRLPNYLPAASRPGQPPPPTSQAWHELTQQQVAIRLRQVEAYVQQHPLTGIGAAFCIGMVLGWFIKRR